MQKLYERARLIQGQLYPIHKHDVHLIEVLEDAILEDPLYMLVDKMSTAASAHLFLEGCRAAIAKHSYME